MFLLCLMRWPLYGFYPSSSWCDKFCLFICICWPIPLRDFWYVAGFDLLAFYAEFFIYVHEDLLIYGFLCCFLVWVSDQDNAGPTKCIWKAPTPFQFCGVAGEVVLPPKALPVKQWSQLTLSFAGKPFSTYSVSLLTALFTFSQSSLFNSVNFMYLEPHSFLLGFPVCWHIVGHKSPNDPLLCLWYQQNSLFHLLFYQFKSSQPNFPFH